MPESVTFHPTSRKCKVCPNFLPPDARPQAKTCSDRCRKLFSRLNKAGMVIRHVLQGKNALGWVKAPKNRTVIIVDMPRDEREEALGTMGKADRKNRYYIKRTKGGKRRRHIDRSAAISAYEDSILGIEKVKT
jgi:predicted nucleic acid-binding Zn ribbon protein